MIVVVLVLAVALLLAAALLVLTDRARRTAQDHARRNREDRRQALAELAELRQQTDASTPVEEQAPAPAEPGDDPEPPEVAPEEPAPAATAPDAGRLDALWEMSVLATTWERRRAGDLSTAPTAAEGHGLDAVLATEVERVRDEGGIPGTSHVALDPPPTPAQAMVVLRAVQLLLLSLARHCDGYDVSVHQWEGRINAVMVCEGFAGPDSVADEATELLAAVAPAGGDVDVDRDPEGRLRARVSLPA